MTTSTSRATSAVPPAAERRAAWWQRLPAVGYGPMALAVAARHATAARATWFVFLARMAEPFFYLFSIGVGVGGLVGPVEGPGGQVVSYEQFVAPGLLATSAMMGAVFESTIHLFVHFKYLRTYDSVLATPVSPVDIARGEELWGHVLGTTQVLSFLAVMWALGLLASPWAVLSLPGALLIRMAFGAAGMVAATVMRSWLDFDLVLLVVMPMFLLSAVFFPLSTYPEAAQWLVRATPLYQGVVLERALVLGEVHWGLLGNVAYLLVMAAMCRRVAARRLGTLLQP